MTPSIPTPISTILIAVKCLNSNPDRCQYLTESGHRRSFARSGISRSISKISYFSSWFRVKSTKKGLFT